MQLMLNSDLHMLLIAKVRYHVYVTFEKEICMNTQNKLT